MPIIVPLKAEKPEPKPKAEKKTKADVARAYAAGNLAAAEVILSDPFRYGGSVLDEWARIVWRKYAETPKPNPETE